MPWPAAWSRARRSHAALLLTAVLLVASLWLLGAVLALLPEPIGSNAAQFGSVIAKRDGDHMTLITAGDPSATRKFTRVTGRTNSPTSSRTATS